MGAIHATTAIAICVAMAALSSHSYAQTMETAPPAKKFPWDTRPSKCFGSADALALPMCQPSRDWVAFGESQTHANMLWGDPDFDLIQRAENELGFSRERFATGEYLFEPWYMSMQAIFRYSGQRGAAIAGKWVKAKGRDGYAVLAEALVQYGQAWTARGSGFGNTVSPEAWELYYQKLGDAYATLDSASPRLRQTGPWHVLKLEIAFQTPDLKSARLDLLRTASDAWPEYISIYSVPMQFAHPKWGGSFETMDGIARFAAEKTRARLGAAMYAVLYERLFRGDSAYTLRDADVDWAMMKQGFRDVESHGMGQPWIWKNFAGLACQIRDRDEALRLYGVYDRIRNSDAPEAADPCRQFATAS